MTEPAPTTEPARMADAGTGTRQVPPPPPGPGVRPPFAAAPTEGRSARRWLGAGLAAAVLAMCCGVGGVAVGGLIFTMIPALNEQAQAAVGDYLDAVVAQDWERAYELRCDADRAEESLVEFENRLAGQPRLDSYELGDLELLETQGDRLRLPAELTYADGTRAEEIYLLAQEQGTGTLQVCQGAP